MNDKLAQFAKKLKEDKLDSFIVTNPINIFYLSGFRGVSTTEREATLVVSQYRTTLVTARLYQHESRKLSSKKLSIQITSEKNQMLKTLQKLLKGTKRVGFEENDLKYGEFKKFKNTLSQIKLIPCNNLIEDLRIIKTEKEIARIEKAQLLSQKAFEDLVKTIKIGQTEKEIASNLARIIKSLSADGLAFETIVAAGAASSRPHYITGQTKIKKGQVLLLDFGAKYKDYCADLSRTIFIGRATDPHKNIYSHVQNAQKKTLEKNIAGLKAKDIYNQANRIFKAHKLDKYFIHGLGHGVGLEIHERPYLRPEIDEVLTENMIFSVEPAIYLPWGGIRIEDLVLIKNGRAKILGRLSDRIIEI